VNSHRIFARPGLNRTAPCNRASCSSPREFIPMTDILLLALGLGFFGLMALYATACEKV
jgi:hypothetical protein